MSWFPKKKSLGRTVQTDVDGVTGSELLPAEIALGSPAAPSATAVHAAITLSNGAAQDITTGITNPDVPRNVTIKGNAANEAGDVVITGTNRNGDVITETIALNEANEVVGNKAFKTVTNIHVPARTTAGDTVSIGRGAKIGLPFFASVNRVLRAFLAGVVEGTAPTVAVDADEIEKNTVALNSTLNGTAVVIDALIEG